MAKEGFKVSPISITFNSYYATMHLKTYYLLSKCFVTSEAEVYNVLVTLDPTN